ncbi:MAG: 1-deoxy-D-xylulose-5-phosphate reductoisomerase [Candidatus Heteroscillospira sp.]|jgi:1-deoxy-D-xylulose-5-phosphate reductoisomerase
MIKTISILGSTGSVGRQSVAVAQRHGFRVCAIAAASNIKLLEEQARLLKPSLAAVYDENAAKELALRLSDTDTAVLGGMDGLIAAASVESAQAVITAVSGAVGLRPTLAAIEAKKRICLANKETLVCAGRLVMAAAKKYGAEILPVDSEHSAIFQSMNGRRDELKSIILTASGGPFRGWSREQTRDVTPKMAVRHPNWSMGAKISVDSATMMNKGLEFIEAMHLFSVSPEEIEVLIHPESIVHSAVEFIDGAVIAQLGVPDMALPIQYALSYPVRLTPGSRHLSLSECARLSFYAPDPEQTPCLALAVEAAKQGGTAPAVLNAANETAVWKFLRGEIGYNDIYSCAVSALEHIDCRDDGSLEAVLAADKAARIHIEEAF